MLRIMRIVTDYGMGARMTGNRIPSDRRNGGTEGVVVLHVGPGARNHRREQGLPVEPSPPDGVHSREDGIPIPGTDLAVRSSEAAGRRDAEVRSHERAHMQALGAHAASGIRLHTRRGPDGQAYAAGGSIGVDLAPVPGDPEATIQKASTILRAAYAPGSPSLADRRVAAEAYRMAAAARREIRRTDLWA